MPEDVFNVVMVLGTFLYSLWAAHQARKESRERPRYRYTEKQLMALRKLALEGIIAKMELQRCLEEQRLVNQE
jgi:hypothetical protein